ncbi:hypothetical protein AB9K26_07185 [Psychroserpens sp. XS_ASV72]|uniref:hypothetical protein n=1 Tax=Psychroserpens sp. XS_ASV72 TaxID=3241293 RepID=UPI0035172B7C
MKVKIALIFIILFNFCNAQEELDYSIFSVSESHVDSITYFFNKMLESEGDEKIELEKLFFESLPNNHYEMSDAMYIHLHKQHVEYKEMNKIPPINVPHPWVDYLSKMDYFDKQSYYKKYFNICIGGEYGADHMVAGFEIYKRFLNDSETACQELKKLNDQDIEAVFYFIFDETHPAYNEENIALYHEMLAKLKKRDTRLYYLLEKSYARVIKEQSQHRH